MFYIRRGNRVYLAPTPSSAITYTTDFIKFTGDLKLAGDLPLVPTHFDKWIISEAKIFWYGMEDPASIPPVMISERDLTRQNSLESIFSDYDIIRQSGSNTENESLGIWPYVRPVGDS